MKVNIIMIQTIPQTTYLAMVFRAPFIHIVENFVWLMYDDIWTLKIVTTEKRFSMMFLFTKVYQ